MTRSDPQRLVVEGLDLFAGAQPLVKGISFLVRPGEMLLVTGPNGVGKSTLLGHLTGRVTPPLRAVFLDGRDVARWSAARLARAGVSEARQRPRLAPDLNVRENLMLGSAGGWAEVLSGTFRPWGRRPLPGRAAALSEAFGLPAGGDGIGGLSAGQRRKVELARCLLRPDARLYVLDEPTVNLDDQAIAVLCTCLANVLRGEDVLGGARPGGPAALVVVEHRADRIASLPCHKLDLGAHAPTPLYRSPR